MDQLYDAGDGLRGWVLILALGAALIAFGVIRFLRREKDPSDPSLARAGGIIFVLLGAGLFAFAGTNLSKTLDVRLHPNDASARIVEGCVNDYHKVVHEDHRLTFTDFSINGRSFHFNSSLWSGGYREAGDTIQPRDKLRVVLRDGRIQKLYRVVPSCR